MGLLLGIKRPARAATPAGRSSLLSALVATLRGVMALRDAMAKVGSVPPNLRRGNARKRCGLCVFYGQGECVKYGAPVRPTQLSDSFKRKESS